MQSNNIIPTILSSESKKKNQDALVVQEKQPDSLMVIKQSEEKLIVDVPKAIVSYSGEQLKQKLAEVQNGDYKLDQWEFKPLGSVFKEGDILVQVVASHPYTATCIISKPGSSSFFTNTDAFHSGNMYADMYTDLQMKEDPEWARKGFTMIYRLDKSFLEKFGHVYIGVALTSNNPQYGSGGKIQFFIDDRHLKLLLSTKLTMSIEYPTETNINKKGARTHHTITTLEWDPGKSSYNIKKQVQYECHIPHVIHMDAKQKNNKSVDPIEPSHESRVSTIEEPVSKPKEIIPSLALEQKITSPITKSSSQNVKSFRGIDTGSRTTQIFARLGGLRRMGGKSALGAFVAVGLYAFAEKIGAITSVNAGEKIDQIQKLRTKTISNQMEEKSLIKELQKMEMELNVKVENGTATDEDRAVLQKIQEELHVRHESDDDRSSSVSEEKADSPRPSRDGMFSSQGIGSSFSAVGRPVVDSLSSVGSTVIQETRDSIDRLADGSSIVAVREESYRVHSPFGL